MWCGVRGSRRHERLCVRHFDCVCGLRVCPNWVRVVARGNGAGMKRLDAYEVDQLQHLAVAQKLAEIAQTIPEHPLHRELVGNEKLVMSAITQMLIDCAANEIDIARSIGEEHNV